MQHSSSRENTTDNNNEPGECYFTSFLAAQATEHGDTGLVLKRIETRTSQSATAGFSYSQEAASDVGTRS